MSSRVAQQMTAAFMTAWGVLGKPRLTIIAPLADWRLPSGYSYQSGEDVVTDAAGQPVQDLSAFWVTRDAPAVPARTMTRTFDPYTGGFVEAGNVAYDVPWELRTVCERAWGVQDALGRLWRVVRVLAELPGAPVTVELEQR